MRCYMYEEKQDLRKIVIVETGFILHWILLYQIFLLFVQKYAW